MIKGASFDGSRIRTNKLNFHNQYETKHSHFLEQDYMMLRDDGFTFFRDTAFMYDVFQGFSLLHYNWDHLDRLAEVSKGQIQLCISHYEWPQYDFDLFCLELARRYKGVFHSYIPAVEVGYWAQQVGSGNWLPTIYEGWWRAYRNIMKFVISSANALKSGDSSCKIGMAEPWAVKGMSYEDQARPFNTIMGKWDKTAFDNHAYTDGVPDLLDIVGLNIYDPFDCNEAICEAVRMFKGKEIMITETSNVWHQHIPPAEWWDIMERETYLSGAEIVCWAPAIQMRGFQGEFIGGYLYDLDRKKSF